MNTVNPITNPNVDNLGPMDETNTQVDCPVSIGPYPYKSKSQGWVQVYLDDPDCQAVFINKAVIFQRLGSGQRGLNTMNVLMKQQHFNVESEKFEFVDKTWRKTLNCTCHVFFVLVRCLFMLFACVCRGVHQD